MPCCNGIEHKVKTPYTPGHNGYKFRQISMAEICNKALFHKQNSNL